MITVRINRLSPAQALQSAEESCRLLLPVRGQENGFVPAAFPLLLPPGCAPAEMPESDVVFQMTVAGDVSALSIPAIHTLSACGRPLCLDALSPLLGRWLTASILLLEEMLSSAPDARAAGTLAETVLTLLLSGSNPPDMPLRPAGRTAPAALIEETQRYVEAHYSENISLASIAGQLFVTPSYLSRIFHRCTGMTFIGYVQKIRLERAKSLLERTALPVTEIAHLTGFGTSSHLGGIFHRAYGQSPNAYRSAVHGTRDLRRE